MAAWVFGRILRSTSMAKMLGNPFDNTSIATADGRLPKGHKRKSAEPARDLDGRQWPTLPVTPRKDYSTLEHTVAKQAEELNLRCTQIADLYNLQQQRANELQTACEEIDRLTRTVSTLLEKTTQHETEAADTKKIIILLEKEKAWLREQLNKALEESGKLSKRLLTVETAFNDRETAIASASEKIESLKIELTELAAEKFTLVAMMESEKQRHRAELNQQKSNFGEKIRRIESEGVNRDIEIKALEEERDRLAKRVGVFEALLKSEREAAEFKIQELAEDLERERVDYSIAARASAAMRKEIVFLLPKLAARKQQTDASEHEISVHNNTAA
jgi:chromosome segregation ATPase